ncbi:uncharacterized protein V1516DRAFT_686304 [Lipomyces oligophaga]|uniref:uncharacterized protein n=1 Tax=Lipomyces oligophaga TaxID=45792 RepID=UPI0034CDBC98
MTSFPGQDDSSSSGRLLEAFEPIPLSPQQQNLKDRAQKSTPSPPSPAAVPPSVPSNINLSPESQSLTTIVTADILGTDALMSSQTTVTDGDEASTSAVTSPSNKSSNTSQSSAADPSKQPLSLFATDSRKVAAPLAPSTDLDKADPLSPPRPKRTVSGVLKQSPERISTNDATVSSPFKAALSPPSSPPSPTPSLSPSHPDRIHELSTNLRTRLSYAMLKVQNGWASQSLDEIEHNVSSSPNSSPVKSNRGNSFSQQISTSSPRLLSISGSFSGSPEQPYARTRVVVDERGHGSVADSFESSPESMNGHKRTASAPAHTSSTRTVPVKSSLALDTDTSLDHAHFSHRRNSASTALRFSMATSSRNGTASTHPTSRPASSGTTQYPAPNMTIKTKGGVAISPASGLPVLGTFSNKVPPGVTRKSTSPTPNRRKSKSQHYQQQRNTNVSLPVTTAQQRADAAAVMAAAAVVAAARDLKSDIQKSPLQTNTVLSGDSRRSITGDDDASRKKSEVEAIESLMFLSSPTARSIQSWGDNDRNQ